MPIGTNIQSRDQAGLGWMESTAATIRPQVRKEKMQKVKYPELIQVDRELDEADDVIVTYIQRPGTGRMTPLSPGATDLPRVDVEYDRITQKAYMDGIAYGWDDFEVRKARKTKIRLMRDRIGAAYEVAERTKEDIVLNGNAGRGWTGMLTNRDKDAYSIAATSQWAADNTETAFETIRRAFAHVRVGTNEVMTPDTLLLPTSAETFLTKMIKDSTTLISIPVIQYIRKYNPYTLMTGKPLKIVTVPQLSTAGPASGDATGSSTAAKATGHPLALLYDSSMEVLSLLMPQDLTFIGPQRNAWTQTWYGRFMLGGVQIYHPKGLCYITNIGSTS